MFVTLFHFMFIFRSVTHPLLPPPHHHLSPPNSSFFLTFNYLKRHVLRKKSTLSVPWWPAVNSLSETLFARYSPDRQQGSSEVYVVDYPWPWRYKKNPFLLFFLNFILLYDIGDSIHRWLCTLYSDFLVRSLSADLPHTHTTTIHISTGETWVKLMCQSPLCIIS